MTEEMGPDDLRRLRPGPVRGELPSELVEVVDNIYDTLDIGSLWGMSRDKWHEGFMRDMHPDREVAVWCRITLAWSKYHERYTKPNTLQIRDAKVLLGALAVISSGQREVAKLGVDASVGNRLLECFATAGEP